MTLVHRPGSPVHVTACGKRRNATMDFRTYRPQRGFGRSERTLAKIAEDLTRFLTKAQRSLTYDTLHLPVASVRPLRIFSWSSPKICRRLLVSGAVLKRTISTSLGHHSPVCF